MDEMNAKIGARLQVVREEMKVSQGLLAEWLGMSRSTVWRIENGERPLRADEMLEIARLLGVDRACLLPDSDMLPSTTPVTKGDLAELEKKMRGLEEKVEQKLGHALIVLREEYKRVNEPGK